MTRAEAISHARVGAQKLWAGTVVVHPNAKTGPHHHGELETVIYVVRGRARFRWGNHLEFVDEAGPGDFVYVPPYVPHQELNARKDQPVEAVIVRSGQEPIVVNLDIPSPEDAPNSRRTIRFTPRRESAKCCKSSGFWVVAQFAEVPTRGQPPRLSTERARRPLRALTAAEPSPSLSSWPMAWPFSRLPPAAAASKNPRR